MRLGLERSIAAISMIAIAWHLIAWNVLHAPAHLSDWPLVAALIIAGTPLTITLLRRVAQGRFGSDFLARLSIVASLILGQYLAGSVVVLMLSGGSALEEFATRLASSVLNALSEENSASSPL